MNKNEISELKEAIFENQKEVIGNLLSVLKIYEIEEALHQEQ